MALFNKNTLKAVVLIEKQNEDGNYQSIATGLLVGFLTETNDDPALRKYRIFLLTNRHVFNDQLRLWLRFDKKDGGNTQRFPITLRDKDGIKWLAHEKEYVDLAMLTISPEFLNANNIDWTFINEELFAYPENIPEIGLELGDSVFLAGFPLGISGTIRNFAIVRSGCIARLDQEIIESAGFFLLDATVFPGNSGGPVFSRPEPIGLTDTKAVNSVFLLGIISGYKIYQEVLYSHQSNPPTIAGVTVENSGLATVVPMNFAKNIYESFLSLQKNLEKEVVARDKAADPKINSAKNEN